MSGEAGMPVLYARRVPGRRVGDPAEWAGKCPLCRRKHRQTAAVGLTEMVLPAVCDRARFYRVVEVGPQ
jgi:hypothetical protein